MIFYMLTGRDCVTNKIIVGVKSDVLNPSNPSSLSPQGDQWFGAAWNLYDSYTKSEISLPCTWCPWIFPPEIFSFKKGEIPATSVTQCQL
jgi:hypothetical protein